MRLALTPSVKDDVVVVDVALTPQGENDPWEMGELKFTLDEWTEFVSHFTSNPTEFGFDVYSTDGDRVIL